MNIRTGQEIYPETTFLFFGIVFGLIFIFLTPPFQVPDETLHFQKAYQTSAEVGLKKGPDGKYASLLPESIILTQFDYEGLFFHPENKTDLNHTFSLLSFRLEPQKTHLYFTGYFSPIPYLPQALGIKLGRLMDLSPLLLMYLGRLFNLVGWIFLVYWAIKTTPTFKWVFCLLALTPMSLALGASNSHDAFTNGICFLWIAFCLKYAFGEEAYLDNKKVAWLCFISVLVALSKDYEFLCFLFLMIPSRKFGSKKRFLLSFLAILSLNLALLFFRFFGVALHGNTPAETSSIGDWHEILRVPISFAALILKTLYLQVSPLSQQFLGVLGWLDTPLPLLLYFFMGIVIGVTALYEKNKNISVNWKTKGLIVAVLCLYTAFMLAAIRLFWPQHSSGYIEGIQGRYFIAVGPLALLLFYNQIFSFKSSRPRQILFLPASIFISLSVTVFVLLKRYYLA